MIDLTNEPGANIALNVMKLAWKYDCMDSFFIRYDEKDYTVKTSGRDFTSKQGFHTLANCSDFFYWGTADAEEVTEENFDILVKSLEDVKLVSIFTFYGVELFCARVRNLRPQRPAMRDMEEPLKELFLSAGPERDPKTEG